MYFLRKCVFKCEMFVKVKRTIKSIIQMRNSLCVPVLAWQLGLVSYSIQVHLMYKKCLGRNLRNKFSKLTAGSIS